MFVYIGFHVVSYPDLVLLCLSFLLTVVGVCTFITLLQSPHVIYVFESAIKHMDIHISQGTHVFCSPIAIFLPSPPTLGHPVRGHSAAFAAPPHLLLIRGLRTVCIQRLRRSEVLRPGGSMPMLGKFARRLAVSRRAARHAAARLAAIEALVFDIFHSPEPAVVALAAARIIRHFGAYYAVRRYGADYATASHVIRSSLAGKTKSL